MAKLTLKQIKEEMIDYRDFFGGDLIVSSKDILKAKTAEELEEILRRHEGFLEDHLCDALSHLSHFRNKLGL